MNGPPCWSLSSGSGWEAAQRVSLLLTARPQPAGGRGRSPRTVAPPTPTLLFTHLDAVSAVQQLKCGFTFEKKMTLIDCWWSCCVQRGLAPPTPWPSVRAWRTGQQPRTSPTSLTLTKRRTNWHRWCGYFLALSVYVMVLLFMGLFLSNAQNVLQRRSRLRSIVLSFRLVKLLPCLPGGRQVQSHGGQQHGQRR